MDDLISRQAAIIQLSYNKIGDDDCDVIIQRDIETIKQLPPAEPKRGKWINDRCSVCGYGVMPWNNTPYCHNCGADMRGKQDG